MFRKGYFVYSLSMIKNLVGRVDNPYSNGILSDLTGTKSIEVVVVS